MLSLHMGAAGSLAEGRAMAVYMMEKQIPNEAMRAAAYYGQTPGIEEAIAAEQGAAPLLRTDIDPVLAEALGLKIGQVIDTETLANILSGHRADGSALPVQHQHQGVTTYGHNGGPALDGEGEVKVRHRVAYIGLTLSAPKHLGLAWAFSETEGERNALMQAHRTARDETMRYIEQQVIRGRFGDGSSERARAAWIMVDHYTARPTQERVCIDPTTGETYTSIESVKVAGDPAPHSHVLMPNLIRTESGRFVAIDSKAFHGRIHEFGAVYQSVLVRELQAMNVKAGADPRTTMSRIEAIPEYAVDEFSKRTREGEKAARSYAERVGHDWEALTPEQRAILTKVGTDETRLDKESNIPDLDAWRAQAARLGWVHKTVIEPEPIAVIGRAERLDIADREGLRQLSEMLSKRAVLGQGEARLAIARGFMAAGGIEHTDDIATMAKLWASRGVLQQGEQTKLIWKEVEHGKIRITTELHRDQELEFIDLARRAVADRRHALASDEISAAIERVGVSYAGDHGKTQREAVESLGTDGGLAVLIGIAGAGKSTAILSPLVDAWKQRGLEDWGTAQAWRQAKDLKDAGIDRIRLRALDPFLEGVHAGRTRLTTDSVVVVDEVFRIGVRQLLDLFRLREKHGFKLVLTGDDEQALSIDAGSVTDLLRRAMGEERIPTILTTIRQEKEHEQENAAMFRRGDAEKAIATKRADGTAVLVPGGYRDAINRVADIYIERRVATADRPNYRITISAPTNADAREISRLVRERRRVLGEIGPDIATTAVTDGRGTGSTLDLAVGDRVRLFAQTRGIFMDDQGRRKSASVGDNGTVLDVVGVDPKNGIQVQGDSGKIAFIAWTALRDRGGSNRLMLGSGEVMTIDTSQGITSHEHIDALPSGSNGVNKFKAYVAASRHRVRHYLVGSMGAELRGAQARRMSGLPRMTPQEAEREAWANLVRNLTKGTQNESALGLLEKSTIAKRQSAKALQSTLVRHQTREAAGQSATTVKQRLTERLAAKVLPDIAAGLAEVARHQAAIATSLEAMHAYFDRKETWRVETAAWMVGEGRLSFDEALDRIVSAEFADRRRGLPVDPLHGVLKVAPGTEDVFQLTERLEDRLFVAVDQYEQRLEEAAKPKTETETDPPRPVTTQRAASGQGQSV